MEEKFKTALKEKGPESIGSSVLVSGLSGKVMPRPSCLKGLPFEQHRPERASLYGVGSSGFMRTFGMDEPMGCYDDIERLMRLCCGAQTWRRCTRSSGAHH